MAELDAGFTAPDFGADASSEPEVEEPVEAEAEAEESPEELESEGDSPSPVEEDDEKKTDPFQERVDKLTKRWRETERALTELERENADLRKKITEVPAQQEEVKTLADFDYDDKQYQTYLFTEAKKQARDEAARILQERDTNGRADESMLRFADAEKAFAEKFDDYYEVAHDRTLAITPEMAEVIRESDIGVDLSYHLGKNPDVARRISKMSPIAMGRELTLIETRLRSEIVKKANEVSKAPPPPKTLSGGSESRRISTTDPRSDKLSDAEWFAAEEKRKAKLRG